jgi:hypothetical protein
MREKEVRPLEIRSESSLTVALRMLSAQLVQTGRGGGEEPMYRKSEYVQLRKMTFIEF